MTARGLTTRLATGRRLTATRVARVIFLAARSSFHTQLSTWKAVATHQEDAPSNPTADSMSSSATPSGQTAGRQSPSDPDDAAKNAAYPGEAGTHFHNTNRINALLQSIY